MAHTSVVHYHTINTIIHFALGVCSIINDYNNYYHQHHELQCDLGPTETKCG